MAEIAARDSLQGGDRNALPGAVLILATLIVVLALVTNEAAADLSKGKCDFDRAAMLALDLDSFDQDFDGGWRKVAEDGDCVLVAADLIRDYIDHHESEARLLIFHEGQMRARGGQTARAIELLRDTKEREGENVYFGWNEYVDATIAFLEKDRNALLAAREALVALPKPGNFRAVDRQGEPVELEWPPNIKVVDGFVNCFVDTYDTAYRECSGL